ncbi:DUF2520 domain-containing protein [Luteibaculum oceani]|nr:DUF2520 domain-containing protein [Luteibaculum oceani]
MPTKDFDKIHIVGSGNVGLQCGYFFKNQGYATKWYGRSLRDIEFQDTVVSTIALENLNAGISDLIILCVNDDSIPAVSKFIGETKALVVHCSGTVGIDALIQRRKGALYFFQSISKGEQIAFVNVPVYLEAALKDDELLLCDWAKKNFSLIKVLSSNNRLKLHLAGVLINNFGNQLLALTSEIFEGSDLELSDIAPLYNRTLAKAMELGPSSSQTGPAKRGDHNTLEKHLKLLEDYHPDWSEIYKRFSNRIKDSN